LTAYLLNLRGSDIPYNPVFQSYLYVGLASSVLFVDSEKVDKDVNDYLKSAGVEIRGYDKLWSFLRKGEIGEGKASYCGYYHIGVHI
jgi:Xaa-Pro aminopeptidase